MNYNPFKEAIPFLQKTEDEKGKDFYICNCIAARAYNHIKKLLTGNYSAAIEILKMAKKATEIVETRIAPHTTLNQWAAYNIDINVEYNGSEMQAYRLRWLKRLAKEWDSEHN